MPTPLSVHRPVGPPKGGIVVIQEAFGVTDHIEDVAERLAGAGWLAVVPHLFHRTGDPKLPYDDISQVIPHMEKLTVDDLLADIGAAIDEPTSEGIPLARVGVVGFCMGGTLALVTATHWPIGAAVTFYGGGVTKGRFGLRALVDEVADLRAPWLGLYGDLDKGIPVEDVEQLRDAASAVELPTEVVRYPDADHGFNCDHRDSYEPTSAADAWARTLAWFATHLGA
jgi:carboxymethylenebutenolidase